MKRTVLENGLRVISLKKPKDHTTRIAVGINYGSIYDKEKNNGLAHFLEHMIFRDTKKHAYKQIIEKIYSCGGFINAYTKRETSIYFGYAPYKNFKNIIKMLLELILQPSFKLDDFKKEKAIVLNEVSERYDELFWCVDSIFLNILYKNHPVRLPIFGKKDSVKKLTLKQIVDTYKKYFVPNNMVVGIFGKFENEILENIKNTFNKIKERKIVEPKFLDEGKKPFKRKALEIRKNARMSYIQTGVKTVSIKNKDAYALDVVATILGGGEASRLSKEIRIKKGLSYMVSAEHICSENYGYFPIYVETKKQNINKVLNLIKKEFDSLKEKKVSQAELERSKNTIITNKFLILDSPIESSIDFVEDEIIWGNVNKSKLYLKNIRTVTSKEILEIANKYFDRENFATTIIKPK